jgi:hypothetical protein
VKKNLSLEMLDAAAFQRCDEINFQNRFGSNLISPIFASRLRKTVTVLKIWYGGIMKNIVAKRK